MNGYLVSRIWRLLCIDKNTWFFQVGRIERMKNKSFVSRESKEFCSSFKSLLKLYVSKYIANNTSFLSQYAKKDKAKLFADSNFCTKSNTQTIMKFIFLLNEVLIECFEHLDSIDIFFPSEPILYDVLYVCLIVFTRISNKLNILDSLY
jgi:hypothetical protein